MLHYCCDQLGQFYAKLNGARRNKVCTEKSKNLTGVMTLRNTWRSALLWSSTALHTYMTLYGQISVSHCIELFWCLHWTSSVEAQSHTHYKVLVFLPGLFVAQPNSCQVSSWMRPHFLLNYGKVQVCKFVDQGKAFLMLPIMIIPL